MGLKIKVEGTHTQVREKAGEVGVCRPRDRDILRKMNS